MIKSSLEMNWIRPVIVMILMAWRPSIVPAADFYVAQNGQTPSGPYTSWISAASNIQDAVNAATTNGTVWVGSGRYTVPPNATNYAGTNVVYINRPLILRSSNGVPATTIIDGGGINRGIAIYYPVSTTNMFIVNGFTVSNCAATNIGGGILLNPAETKWTGIVQNCVISDNTVSWGVWGIKTNSYGGGIGCDNGVGAGGIGLYISNCVIRANRALSQGAGTLNKGQGGGIFVRAGYATGRKIVVSGCTIESNSATSGGGAGMIYGPRTFENCVFRDNSAINDCGVTAGDTSGGGVFLDGGAELAAFRNCLFYGNVTIGGAGGNGNGAVIYSTRSIVLIENSTIVSNKGAAGYAVHVVGVTAQGAGLGIRNSIIISNSANNNWSVDGLSNSIAGGFTNYSYNSCLVPTNSSNYLPGSGNITNSPYFVDFAGQNFRLTVISPCINSGLNQSWMNIALDLDSHSRIDRFSGTVDMGCYEYLTQGMMFKVH